MLTKDKKIMLHPTFETENAKYIKAERFFDGEISVIASHYLLKLAIEEKTHFVVKNDAGKDIPIENTFGKKQWERRSKLLDYFNHTAHIINILLSSISSQSVTVKDVESNLLVEILDDVTGFDDSFVEFLYDTIRDFLLYGKVGVLVDSEPDNPTRPFLIKFKPQDILNWKLFKSGPRKGQLEYVTLEEAPIEDRRRVRDIYIGETGKYNWVLYEESDKDNFEPIDSGEGELDFIPFVIIGKGYVKNSAVKDVIPISEVRLNRKSSQDNILYLQGFQRSALFSEHAQKDIISFVEGSFAYCTDPNGKFETIEPVDPIAHEREVKSLDRLAFRIGLKQVHQQADDSRAAQSADSKAADNDVLCEYLESIVDLFVKRFSIILDHTVAMSGLKDKPQLAITKQFRLADSDIELQNRTILFTQARSLNLDEVAKSVLKQGISKTINNEDEVARLVEYIDNSAGASPALTLTNPEE